MSIVTYEEKKEKFLKADNGMPEHNKKLIIDFLEHVRLGKPILNKRKKPIGDTTAKKYINLAGNLSRWFNHKAFDKLEEKDVDDFRKRLKSDVIKQKDGTPYSDSSKRDYEYKLLAPFLRWLGKPELANFVSDYDKEKEIPTLTRNEVEKIISECNLRDGLIFMLLFDGGFRASEFLSVTFADIKDDKRDEGYYKIRIKKSKTLPRTISVPLCTELLDRWLEKNKEHKGTAEPLIKLCYTHFNGLLHRKGMQILKKKVYPHLLRHSSATYYCHKLNQYQLCKRYGWSMSSDMPRRYIDREGIDEEEINKVVVKEEEVKWKKEVKLLQEELSMTKEQHTAMMERMNKLEHKREGYDGIMTELVDDPKIQKILLKKLVEKGLMEKVVES